MNFYGFTFMKGVDSLDYPYLEVLEALGKGVDEVFIALGHSDDCTEEKVIICKNPVPINIISTVWEDKRVGDGGSIFSQQANIALGELRKKHGEKDEAWAIFFHCDEMFHPDDWKRIKEEILWADQEGFDAITYRFLHFWKDHYHIAVNKRWHPHEIRAFKLKSSVVCYGDAQGFTGAQKTFHSDFKLFHYGHVREKEKHEAKQNEILKRIRPGEKFKKYKRRERKAFKNTLVERVLFAHPKVMHPRIKRLGDVVSHPLVAEVYILGDQKDYSLEFIESINVEKINWVHSLNEVPSHHRKSVIIPYPTWFQRLRNSIKSQNKMLSPLAPNWDPEMLLLIRLSERGIGLKSRD